MTATLTLYNFWINADDGNYYGKPDGQVEAHNEEEARELAYAEMMEMLVGGYPSQSYDRHVKVEEVKPGTSYCEKCSSFQPNEDFNSDQVCLSCVTNEIDRLHDRAKDSGKVF